MAIFSISHSESGKKLLTLKSPVDLSHIDTYECTSSEEISSIMTQAKVAQSEWKKTTLKERVELMHRVADVVIQQQDRIMDVVMRETGKPEQEAMSMEVFSAVDSLVFYAKRAQKWLADKKIKMHGPMQFLKKTIITYNPRGVVAVITPWNGPFILSINPVIQAVLCGNSVVVKPSEVTPMSGALVQEIFALAEAPEHLVQTVIGDGETGAELIDQGPDKVSFTGSVATGKKIAAKCGEMLIPYSLELGGKDAMIVCSDADIKDAASGAVDGIIMPVAIDIPCGCMPVSIIYPPYCHRRFATTGALRISRGELRTGHGPCGGCGIRSSMNTTGSCPHVSYAGRLMYSCRYDAGRHSYS